MGTRLFGLIACLSTWTFLSLGSATATPNPIVNSTQDNTKPFGDYIKALGVKLMLADEDARTYSSDLDALVGNYFYVDEQGNIVLVGRPDNIPKATSVQLKEKIEYQAAVDNGSSISATLPWLSFIFGHNTKTSIVMQDIASVVGTSDPTIVKINAPAGIAPAGKQLWFISGATVTLVSATQYADTNIQGSSIIQVGGKFLYTKNILQNAWIISLNRVPVSSAQFKTVHDTLGGRVVRIKKLNRKVH